MHIHNHNLDYSVKPTGAEFIQLCKHHNAPWQQQWLDTFILLSHLNWAATAPRDTRSHAMIKPHWSRGRIWISWNGLVQNCAVILTLGVKICNFLAEKMLGSKRESSRHLKTTGVGIRVNVWMCPVMEWVRGQKKIACGAARVNRYGAESLWIAASKLRPGTEASSGCQAVLKGDWMNLSGASPLIGWFCFNCKHVYLCTSCVSLV